MYTTTRADGAALLNVSTRTIDRYIRADKIRSKKIGKQIYLHADDIERLHTEGITDTEDDILSAIDAVYDDTDPSDEDDESEEPKKVPIKSLATPTMSTMPVASAKKEKIVSYEVLYRDTQKALEEKETIIKDLSHRNGILESELKNSISISEHKKTTFLLESAKTRAEDEKRQMKTRLESGERKEANTRNMNAILAVIFTIMLLTLTAVWLMKV